MRLRLTLTQCDIRKVREFIHAQSSKKIVQDRHRNLKHNKPVVDQERFWRALVCMRLTSRQKSGPDGAITRLRLMNPFPLSARAMRENLDDLEGFAKRTLHAVRGMRDYNVAARQFAFSFEGLEGGDWDVILNACNRLRKASTSFAEREVANLVADKFGGIGPKQSRNVLQALGLTRYEVPIDSRFVRWLNHEIGFPIPVSAKLLSDAGYYEFVLDEVQNICANCEVYPCILDAAIFASGDPDTWTPEMMSY